MVSGPGENGGRGRDPHRVRGDVRDMVRAIVAGWLEGDTLANAARDLADILANCEDPRARVNAAKGLLAIAQLGQQIGEADDKTDRLDGGQATENVTYVVKIPGATRGLE